jgi:hypothetical protein
MIKIYTATVVSIDDPEKRGRITVACSGIMGDEETEIPFWIEPNLQWGWFVIPDVGETIDIISINDPSQDEVFGESTIDSLELKWTGVRYWTNEETEDQIEARPVAEDFKTNYGKRRGFLTPAGHLFIFDDTEGKEKISLTWHQKGKYQYLSFDEKGNIIIANKNGTMIFMDSENAAFTIIDENSNTISMDNDSIKLIDHRSNIIEMKDGVIQILSQGNVTVAGNVIDIKGGTVNLLDGADESVVRGDSFKTTYDAHTHATGMGPSGPPAVPLPANNLSSNCKVGS